MMRLGFLVLISAFLCSCGSGNKNFKISGKFRKPVVTTVYLNSLGIESTALTDSCATNEESKFKLESSCSEASFFVVQYAFEKIYLIVKPGDKIAIDIDNTLPSPGYYVEGSNDSRLVREIVTAQKKVLDEISAISIAYEQSKQNPETFIQKKAHFDNLYATLLDKHKEFTNNFIYRNSTSLATIFALYQNFGKTNQPLYDKFEDFAIFNFVDSNLTKLYPNVPAVLALNRDVTEIKAQEKHKQYSDKLLTPGRTFPEFIETSLDSVQISSAGFNGKPLVFFFFASWNKASVQELSNLVKISQNPQFSEVKIMGISFDSDTNRLRTFVAENNIQFPVFCDYLYWNSKYVKLFAIRAIPDILLIDKSHLIYSKNINSNELLQTLEEWKENKLF